MMCITLREACGPKSWWGRRSIEIIGFHNEKEEVHILFILYLENLLDNGDRNYLELLHPGNVKYKLVRQPWPLPPHPDELNDPETGFFSSVYERAFKFDNGKGRLYQTNGLSAWDSWHKTKEERVTIWPKEERLLKGTHKGFDRLYPPADTEGFAPFTGWRLGPFTRKGPVLIAFEVRFHGDTYRELITSERVFTVDGPERLLSRITYSYIPRLERSEQSEWLCRLKSFRNFIRSWESHDVILLGQSFASPVKVIQSSWVSAAPLQLESKEVGARYITANASFTLSLEYVKRRQQHRKPTEPEKKLGGKFDAKHYSRTNRV